MNTASDIKRMENVLNSLNGYYSDRSSVFQRFLEYVIAGFDASCAKLEHPYNSKDGALCMALFQEWVMIMRDNVSEWQKVMDGSVLHSTPHLRFYGWSARPRRI